MIQVQQVKLPLTWTCAQYVSANWMNLTSWSHVAIVSVAHASWTSLRALSGRVKAFLSAASRKAVEGQSSSLISRPFFPLSALMSCSVHRSDILLPPMLPPTASARPLTAPRCTNSPHPAWTRMSYLSVVPAIQRHVGSAIKNTIRL